MAVPFLVVTIGYPVAVDQGWVRYNAYTLPLLLLGGWIFGLFFVVATDRCHNQLAELLIRRKAKSTVVTILIFAAAGAGIGTLTGIGYFYALRRSKEHLSALARTKGIAEGKVVTRPVGETANQVTRSPQEIEEQAAREVQRRQALLIKLRQEYILSHDNLTSALLAGLEEPPADWINGRLKALGETWTVSEPPNKQHRPSLSTPYSEMSNEQLRSAALVLTSKIRRYIAQFEYDFRQMLEEGQQATMAAKSEDEKRRIWQLSTRKSENFFFQGLQDYQARYKVDAILLRDEMLARLPPGSRNDKVRYNLIANMFVIEDVAVDLERLAKSLK